MVSSFFGSSAFPPCPEDFLAVARNFLSSILKLAWLRSFGNFSNPFGILAYLLADISTSTVAIYGTSYLLNFNRTNAGSNKIANSFQS